MTFEEMWQLYLFMSDMVVRQCHNSDSAVDTTLQAQKIVSMYTSKALEC